MPDFDLMLHRALLNSLSNTNEFQKEKIKSIVEDSEVDYENQTKNLNEKLKELKTKK